MKRTSFATMPCPLARALHHFTDPWNGLVIREAFYGARRYDDFKLKLGIATNTLSRVLKDLVEAGLLERHVYNEKPIRFEYLLTPEGRDLRPVLLTLLDWGCKHRAMPDATVALTDSLTGETVQLGLIDRRTGKEIDHTHKVIRRGNDVSAGATYAFPDAQLELAA